MQFEKYYNFYQYRMGYNQDQRLTFCIVDDENNRGLGFTSASMPDLTNFFCSLDKPKVNQLEDGTYEIKIIFCHAEKNDNDMVEYLYWHDVYIFDPEAFTVKFERHEIITPRRDDEYLDVLEADDGFEEDSI